jgi:NAD(P)-dependent dehydrogenase (short-subunit alcohol dehydrogenase family)
MRTLENKVAVITGAASGIGRALAVNLAARGSLLALSDVDEPGLARTVALATEAGARAVRSDHLDVSDRAAFRMYARSVAEHFGQVDLVINNAGVALTGQVEDLSYRDLDWIVGVNFWGVVHGTMEFLPHLIASGDGHLVNMSSVFGLMSTPGQGAYNATKYAVRGLTEALREEMLIRRCPVGVTVVHPGGIKTAMARNSRVSWRADKEATIRLFEDRLARTKPEHVADVVISAVLHNRARVLVGPDAHALHWLVTACGARYQDLMAAVSRRVLERMRVVR